jgi:hypothetical protein
MTQQIDKDALLDEIRRRVIQIDRTYMDNHPANPAYTTIQGFKGGLSIYWEALILLGPTGGWLGI